jgi:LDH2 family malate/lactate/ureidoglycolate dehydrogenase
MAMDISRFATPDLFKSVASQFQNIMHGSGEANSVLLPGEFEYLTKCARDIDGISISSGVMDNINQTAKFYNVI